MTKRTTVILIKACLCPNPLEPNIQRHVFLWTRVLQDITFPDHQFQTRCFRASCCTVRLSNCGLGNLTCCCTLGRPIVVARLVLVGRAGGNQQWRAALPTGESRPTIPTPVSFRLLPAPTSCLQLLASRDQLTLRVFYLPELPRLPLSGSSSFCSGAGVKPHLAPTSLLCLL